MGTPRTGFFALGGLAQREYEQAAKAVHWKSARPGALEEVRRDSFVMPKSSALLNESGLPDNPVLLKSSTRPKNSTDLREQAEKYPAECTERASATLPTEASFTINATRHTPAVPELPEGVEFAFIPLEEPLDAASEALMSAGLVEIRATEREVFQREFLPALSRALPVLTPNPTLVLPRIRPQSWCWISALIRRFVTTRN